jgi:hypothetical protein
VRDVRLESIVDYHGDRRGHGVVNSRGGVVSEDAKVGYPQVPWVDDYLHKGDDWDP